MRRLAPFLVTAGFLFAALAPAQEHESHGSKITSTPQWEKIKSLAGEWEGYARDGEQKIPTRISVRITGDGSAVMHWMDAGTPHEMVTMFHMDQEELLATHYCSAHNQPRMRAVPSSNPTQIAFEFKDGTNIRPGDGYMRRLVVTFIDADHHNEEWGYDANGKIQAGTFYLTRVKRTANS
jgi:YD repeat-containing protein